MVMEQSYVEQVETQRKKIDARLASDMLLVFGRGSNNIDNEASSLEVKGKGSCEGRVR